MAGLNEESLLLFAIPKKGRIHEEVMTMLSGIGVNAKRPDRLDVALCQNLPIKLVFLPAKDIPAYIMDGEVDLGISGTDMLEETLHEKGIKESPNIEATMKLGFGKCKLCLLKPKSLGKVSAEEFIGKRIVTSFPYIAKSYFDSLAAACADGTKPSETKIKCVSGSVEAACGLGLADAVIDLVETGTTMRAAGLEVASDILETESVLMEQKHDGAFPLAKLETINLIKERIQGYAVSQRFVMVTYNCPSEAVLNECVIITPGARSPTITNLAEKGSYSVSALIEKSKSHNIMDSLKKAGARDIICMQLSNTRF